MMMQTAHRNFHRERAVLSMPASVGMMRRGAASTTCPALLPTGNPPSYFTNNKQFNHKTGLALRVGLFSRPLERSLLWGVPLRAFMLFSLKIKRSPLKPSVLNGEILRYCTRLDIQ